MSHLTPVGVKYIDRNAICKALDALGLVYEGGPLLLTNARYTSDDARIQVDLMIRAASFGLGVGVDAGFELTKAGNYDLHFDAFDVDCYWRNSEKNPFREFNSGFAETFTMQYTIESLKLAHGSQWQLDAVENSSQGLRLRSTLKTAESQLLTV
jgi:hypothetical protein